MSDDDAGLTRRALVVGSALCGVAAMTSCAPQSDLRVKRLDFDDLDGWAAEDHEDAARVFAATFAAAAPAPSIGVTAADWTSIFETSQRTRYASARAMFEALFEPVLVQDGREALFTAYFEPEVAGDRAPSAKARHPLYRRPADLGDEPYLTRAEISGGALDGRAAPLVWLDDPVDGFFLEIQGSGVVVTPAGERIRIGFAGRNNHPYVAIGRVLVESGDLTLEAASAEGIKAWLRAHPARAKAVMNANPSYVFFEERASLAADAGPIGAMGASVTAGRSVAIDPALQPLGAPLWIDAGGVDGFEGRLMIAQDVGGAIKGAQRADLFIGTGEAAGGFASDVRAGGRIVTLMPKPAAERLAAAS